MTVEMEQDTVRAMTDERRAAYDAETYDRVVRFKDVPPNWSLVPNCELPGHQRANFVYVGTDWSATRGVLPKGENFSFGMMLAEPGKGAPLHAHTTEEVFMPLTGEWLVYWGANKEHEVTLKQWDAISIPPPVYRGFRNVGQEDAYLLFILGGGDPPVSISHPEVVAELQAAGIGAP